MARAACACAFCSRALGSPLPQPPPPTSRLELAHTWGDPYHDANYEVFHIVRIPLAVAGGAVKMVACHKGIAARLGALFAGLHAGGHQSLIRTYDGAFNIRPIRGSQTPSLHSWGLAIDLNAEAFPLGSTERQDAILLRGFAAQGFFYGGNFQHRKDPMHWQYTHSGF